MQVVKFEKKRLIISFTGGRTSAFMTWWLMNIWDDRNNWEIIIVFANTGKEVEGTLFFIDECASEWGINIVWIEGFPSNKGKGWSVIPKVVSYETASRNGEPYEAMIARLGIPSSEAPFCSPQLKRAAIRAYARSIGWGSDYTVAVGIRVDEPKRVKRKSKTQRLLYPLVDLIPTNKYEVHDWWKHQSFNLNIHSDDGNCDGCWKKSFPTLIRIMQRKPDTFDWWEQMTEKYKDHNPRHEDEKLSQNFYRGNKSVFDIRKLANMSQSEIMQMSLFDEKLDGCAESCEAF